MPLFEYACRACGHHFEYPDAGTGDAELSCLRQRRAREAAVGIRRRERPLVLAQDPISRPLRNVRRPARPRRLLHQLDLRPVHVSCAAPEASRRTAGTGSFRAASAPRTSGDASAIHTQPSAGHAGVKRRAIDAPSREAARRSQILVRCRQAPPPARRARVGPAAARCPDDRRAPSPRRNPPRPGSS